MYIFKPSDRGVKGGYHVEMHDGAPRAYAHCPLCGYDMPILFPVGADGAVQHPDQPTPASAVPPPFMGEPTIDPNALPGPKKKQLVRCHAGFCNFADEVMLDGWKG